MDRCQRLSRRLDEGSLPRSRTPSCLSPGRRCRYCPGTGDYLRFPGTRLDRRLGCRRKLPAGAGYGVPQCPAPRRPGSDRCVVPVGPDRPLAKGEPGSSPPTSPAHHPRPGRTGRLRLPDGPRRPIVVAAGINPPSPDLGRLLLAHANAGASLVVDGGDASSWWKGHGLKAARQYQDRGFYTLGAGRILVYKESIIDPGDFALDILDLAAGRRPVRLWDASAVIAMAAQAGARANLILRLVNYGSPTRGDIMAQVRGIYSS